MRYSMSSDGGEMTTSWLHNGVVPSAFPSAAYLEALSHSKLVG